MNPILCNGQKVTIQRFDDYIPGDILVFEYKNKRCLVHRLLKEEDGRLFCKGDNSFRIEDITKKQIIGAVRLQQDSNRDIDFLAASYSIGELFRKCKYNIDATKKHPLYQKYAYEYLGAIV